MNMETLFSLEGKVALVTGAAYGIGFAIAEALAGAGAKIAFNCRSQEHMEKALEAYEAKGIHARGYLCDVTDEKEVEKTDSCVNGRHAGSIPAGRLFGKSGECIGRQCSHGK